MICQKCETELDTLASGEMRCPTCGALWANALMVFGGKRADTLTTIEAMEINTTADCLQLVAALSDLDAAYSEIIDELTNGAKI